MTRALPPLLLVSAVMASCYDSAGIEGHTDASTETPTATCGNGTVDSGEECDDGDSDECNGCTSECLWSRALHVDDILPAAVVAATDIPCIPCPFTIEMWFKLEEPDSSMTLIDIPGWLTWTAHTDTFELEREFDGGFSMGLWPVPHEPGTWHHAAFVCKFDHEHGFWRGSIVADGLSDMGGGGSSEMPVWSCVETMQIGINSGTGGGVIDDLRISNQGIYSFSDPYELEPYLSVRSDTVALWNFDRAVYSVIPDVSGNGHDASLMEGSLVPDECHQP